MWSSMERTMLPATAYGLLAVSAACSTIYYLNHCVFSPGLFAFGLYFVTGLIGFLHYAFLREKKFPRSTIFFKVCKNITSLYGLPIVVSDLYYKYNFSVELIIAHLALPLLALVPYGTSLPADKSLHQFRRYSPFLKVKDNVDFVIFSSIVALTVISTLANNYFGILAAFIYAVTHFLVTNSGYVERLKMPAEPLYIFGMGLFCLTGMRAMVAYYTNFY